MQKNHLTKKINVSTAFLLLVLLCSGCVHISDINDNSVKKETLVWGIPASETIYPLKVTNDNYWSIIPNIYNGLVEFDVNFQIIPALAVSWNNPDNLTWRFNLRRGVKFHNGNTFTAADVKNTIENMTTGYDTIIKEIIIPDDYMIEIKTFTPTPSLLSSLAHHCIIYCKNTTLDQGLIGTGPYRLSEYELGNYTTLERFDEYWGEKPEIKTVIFKAIENDTTRLNALLSGDIDIAEYNVDDTYEELAHNQNITIAMYPPLSTYVIGFDLRENDSYAYPDGLNPTADIRVRKAIYQAINITPLINGPLKGLAKPESQFITPYIFGYNPKIHRLPYNISASRQLLAEAGYENGFNITMDCITKGYPYNAESCYLIAQQLTQVGIHVTMNNLSIDEFNQKVVIERNTSMYLVGYGIISVDGGLEYDLFIRSVGNNLGILNSGYYSNPEVDRLGIAASQEMDTHIRLQQLQEGFRIAMVDDVALIPLFSQELFSLTTNNIVFPPRADLRMIVKDIKFN
jgi:peptide/nickel transport system substrate-binding protein